MSDDERKDLTRVLSDHLLGLILTEDGRLRDDFLVGDIALDRNLSVEARIIKILFSFYKAIWEAGGSPGCFSSEKLEGVSALDLLGILGVNGIELHFSRDRLEL